MKVDYKFDRKNFGSTPIQILPYQGPRKACNKNFKPLTSYHLVVPVRPALVVEPLVVSKKRVTKLKKKAASIRTKKPVQKKKGKR